MLDRAPVALFVYARPGHTKSTIDALCSNRLADETLLYVFCDGPKDGADQETLDRIAETRALVRSLSGFREVRLVEQEHNVGLDRSVLMGINYVLERHDRVIVVEDDIQTSPGFLTFLNEGLDKYANDHRIWHISAYLYPVKDWEQLPTTFFLPMGGNWGWATWKRAWKHYTDDLDDIHIRLKQNPELLQKFNLGGHAPMLKQLLKNLEPDYYTWDIFWHSSIVLGGALSLFPRQSLVHNTGHDGSGEHQAHTNIYRWDALAEHVDLSDEAPIAHEQAAKLVSAFFKGMVIQKENPSLKEKIGAWLKK